ncbi:MAG: hypothetical protein HY078_05350 [Elusimicrobia bacterium]|nr:hypothetical protein [Elusimicrobiota bacterium]
MMKTRESKMGIVQNQLGIAIFAIAVSLCNPRTATADTINAELDAADRRGCAGSTGYGACLRHAAENRENQPTNCSGLTPAAICRISREHLGHITPQNYEFVQHFVQNVTRACGDAGLDSSSPCVQPNGHYRIPSVWRPDGRHVPAQTVASAYAAWLLFERWRVGDEQRRAGDHPLPGAVVPPPPPPPSTTIRPPRPRGRPGRAARSRARRRSSQRPSARQAAAQQRQQLETRVRAALAGQVPPLLDSLLSQLSDQNIQDILEHLHRFGPDPDGALGRDFLGSLFRAGDLRQLLETLGQARAQAALSTPNT